MKQLVILISFILLLAGCSESSKKILSPNGETAAKVQLSDGQLSLQLNFGTDTVFKALQPKLISNESNILERVKILNSETGSFNETWETVNGKNPTVINHYNFENFVLQNAKGESINLEVRVFNDGFAYRFVLPEGYQMVSESSNIILSEDHTFWAYNGENHNVGPVKLSEYKKETIRNPIVFKTEAENYFAIHEAAIFEHAPFSVKNLAGKNALQLDQTFEIAGKESRSSWRAFMLGNRPGDLIENNLLVNLNEPCKIEEPSWIKVGRSMWDWRVWGYTAEDGFEYGLNTVSHKRFIDFAAENNIQLMLLDADWYGPEFSAESDPTTTREGVDIEECMAYAKEKGIGIILYLNDVGAKKFGLERVLKQFAEWGASGVKYGFMHGSWKDKVANTRRVVELCAKYKLTVNFHDNPVPPSGDRRTWPNLITKEFGHSQADAKHSHFPETMVTTVFVNMLAGPLDLCNGWFSLNSCYGNGRVKVFEEIPGTVVADVAELIVIHGGIFVMPDSPEEYLKKDDLFDCIRQMPAHFDTYKVLDGEIGEFITVVRSSGEEWFVGSITNREARTLDIDFNFLEEGKRYKATFYEDATDTHFINNKEAYKVKTDVIIKKESTVSVKLAPGGGNAIWVRPIK